MLKAKKPGGEACPSGPQPVTHFPHWPPSGGCRVWPGHTPTPAHQLKTQCPKTSPATLGSSAFPAGPPGGQIQALAFGFRQLAALSPPSRALTVHEIWVPRRLLIPGDLGFPMQWWRPRLPFLERLIPTSGQFPRRYMRRWGDQPRRPPSDRAGGAGAEVGPFPPSGRAGEAQVRMVARLGMAALWHPELLPPCLQLPRQTSRTPGITWGSQSSSCYAGGLSDTPGC